MVFSQSVNCVKSMVKLECTSYVPEVMIFRLSYLCVIFHITGM